MEVQWKDRTSPFDSTNDSKWKIVDSKEIQDRLEAKGIAVTQTTLSRDLRDLGLVKVKRKDQLYYILPNEPEADLYYVVQPRQVCLTSRIHFGFADRAGRSDSLANGVDEMSDERILGTVAEPIPSWLSVETKDAAIEIKNEI